MPRRSKRLNPEETLEESDSEADKTIINMSEEDVQIESDRLIAEVQELRSQLAAAVANATYEKAERILLQEQLSHQLQQITPPVETQPVSTAAATNKFETQPVSTAAANTFETQPVSTVAANIFETQPVSTAATIERFETQPVYSITSTAAAAANIFGIQPVSSVPSIVANKFAAASTMCTTTGAKEYAMFYSPSPNIQPPISTNTMRTYCATTSTCAPRVVSYLTPLNALQPFAHRSTQSAQLSPPPSTFTLPTPSTHNYFGQQHVSSYGSSRQLQHLPDFNGRPEEWPMFCTAYHESSVMFNYTKVENNFRLQKCIKGDAKEAVESLLIHPDNVDRVMATLEFLYGRPELLLRSQLMKVRDIAPIPEGKLELLIPFATKVQNLSTFLEASGLHQHMANPTLIDELSNKLPMSKRLEWAQYSIYVQPYATIKHFDEWLTSVARLVCLVTPSYLPPPVGSGLRLRNVLHVTEEQPPDVTNEKCRFCKMQKHPVTECSKYNNLSTKGKWEFVKKNRLCFSCLRFGHSVRTCKRQRSCGIDSCSKVHHLSLHETQQQPVYSLIPETERTEQVVTNSLLNCDAEVSARILFRILPVRLYGSEGDVVRTYALLDEGSSVTILNAELAKKLHLSGRSTNLRLKWFGKETLTNKDSYVVSLRISADKDEAERYSLENVQTVDDLSLPTQSICEKDLPPKYRHLALPSYENAEPQILIGLDNCHLGTPMRIMETDDSGPIAAETKLGWTVYGRTPGGNPSHAADVVLLNYKEEKEDASLNQLVDDFFNMDSFGVKKPTEPLVSPDEKRALQILSSTTIRINNRYQTGLLWKDDVFEMPSSYEMAKRRLWSLESKLQKEPEFATTYKGIIASYLEKGYARRLTNAEASITTPKTWYLPHFGVKNPNKPGKIRLVFDAAAKVRGTSLNSFLIKGPDDLKPLMAILYNFRLRPIAITGDVKEMFHQVVIRSEDQNSQRFLWRENKNDPVNVYVMQSMIFGASCSPCSANYVKNTNALRFMKDCPRAVKSIVDHHYVDDYVDSFDTVAEAIKVTRAVISIHKSGGFELRNFASNSRDVLQDIYDTGELSAFNHLVDMNVEAATEKVLGMCWDPVDDVFVFRLKFPRVSQEVIVANRCPTKREFLSVAMSIFDPYGMIANFVIYVKLLLQSIWRYGVEWDEPIPDEIFKMWQLWKEELPKLNQCRVPRCHNTYLSSADKIVLHTFVDASEEAFSAVTYLRIEVRGQVSISFIGGKTKCAPKKLISIPRLELSAAILGIRLCNSIVEHQDLPISDRIFWSDSKTVLNWLKSEPRRQKQFVAFRIAEILEGSQLNQWHWIPSKLNPADEATRARYPPNYNIENKWLNGPSFLALPEDSWPSRPDDIEGFVCHEEMKSKFILLAGTVSTQLFDLSRFSKYSKLLRTSAWVIRFIRKCQGKSEEKGEFSASEIENAERVLLSAAQYDVFSGDIVELGRQKHVTTTSSLYKLTPYVDDDGLLRVYGRIDAATTVPYATRRPIILPKNHPLTQLLVAHYHRRLHHQNDDTIVNEIRQRFWVPSLRAAVKKAKSDCMTCKFRAALPLPPLMGQLPEDRLTPFIRPFTYTGLDYFGPVYVTIGRRREKRWIALFTCMTVRAVHLEIAADLSTDACILCIRNFVNRRGVPKRMRSDNGTNFLGAKNELLNTGIFDNDAIKSELSSRNIEWIFNCPSNPHAGGCWERLVRSVKRVLSYSLKELAPRPETLCSALIEAENIVNSRPLTHLPVSTDDEDPLTPNHFLLGCTNSTQTPGPLNPKALCLRKQWRVSQQIKDRFWKRWMREYLPMLTRRCKWFQRVPPLEINDLVLICDADVPRSDWRRGRVAKVFLGQDGQVRSAEVKTATGLLRRPAVKLAKLDISDSEASDKKRAPHGGWGVMK